MGVFKQKQKRQQSTPITMWLNGDNATDILCPSGYTPLSKNEEIRRCVFKIADLVSNMTIMLMSNGENGDIRIKNELSKKIDVYPNKNMTRKTFIHKIVTDMLIYGNAVVFPTTENGHIDNLQILNAENITFKDYQDTYVCVSSNKIYKSDEVLHFVYNPDDEKPYKGRGISTMISKTIDNLLQANATKTGFLKSKWKPSLIISINSDAEELQDSEKRNKILGSYTKTTEIGEPWLIPAGEVDVKAIQPLTLNDLAIQDSITLDMKTIARGIGIPAFLVGIGEFNKDEYNNFISTTIMSIATIIQQELSKKILVSDSLYFKFNSKSLLQYNLNEKVGFVKEMIGGGMLNRNEARCEFDYSPVDEEGMNDYTVLENYLQIKDLSKQKKLKGGDDNDDE